MRLGEIDVPNELVLTLAGMLRRDGFDSTAAKLESALTWGETAVLLTPLDRTCLLRCLVTPTASLQPLRDALLAERDRHAAVGGGAITLRCVECACVSTTAPGWVALIADDPDDVGHPSVAAYRRCSCKAAPHGRTATSSASKASSKLTNGRRSRHIQLAVLG